MDGFNECSPCELRKFVIPEIITGVNAGLLIGRYLRHYEGQNPLIVTDQGVRKSNWFRKMEETIGECVKSYVIFDQVTPNPKDTEVMAGAGIFIDRHCDIIIAIGGGSPMDCAKCISIVSTNGGHVLDYDGVDMIDLPGPPLICVPTTAGTSADVSQFAIVLDTVRRMKKAIISKKAVPDLALIDPVPLLNMDPYLTACTAMDALTHAIEAYVSNAQSPLTDIHAKEAIRLISRNIEKAVSGTRNMEIMCQMMLGSLHAGLAFSNASLGAVHAMAHSLGGFYDLPHGECNSVLLRHVIELNFDSAPLRYRKILQEMGIEADRLTDAEVKSKLLAKVSEILEKVGIQSFVEIDSNDSDFEFLAEGALNDPCMVTNPRILTKVEVKEIYERIVRFQK